MMGFIMKHMTIVATLFISVLASEEESRDAAKGTSLAQHSMKIHRAGVFSENDGDAFGQLEDVFDVTPNYQLAADGGVLAQITAKLGGAKVFSEFSDAQIKDFAGLDDIFGNTPGEMNTMDQEPFQFSLKAALTSPSLYVTVAILLLGFLVLTSPPTSS
mmetsp:Transcript_116163/g.182742  ORF Transcript_116163/g.182742 Transcript_116163/m.182742 type:complete len:159 (-) Transcript_116163:165-641(-)